MKLIFILLVISVALAFVLYFYLYFQYQTIIQNPDVTSASNGEIVREPVSTESLEGFSKSDISTQLNAILLTRENPPCNETLSMETTEFQIYSIENGLRGRVDFRPTVHDAVKDILENFGIELSMVKIERMEEDTYFSKIILRQGNKTLLLDSKPSDAIAIAVRFDAPVYVKDELFENFGKSSC